MVLTLVSESKIDHDVWNCRDESGGMHNVDFMVDGGVEREQLKAGAKIIVDRLTQYIELAMHARLANTGDDNVIPDLTEDNKT